MAEIILAILSAYGLSTLVSDYDGPFNVLTSLRGRFSALYCTVCASFWLSVPVSLLFGVGVVEWLAVVGGSILLIHVDEAIK